MKKIIKVICGLISVSALAVAGFSFYLATLLPDTFLITQGSELKVAGMPFLLAQPAQSDTSVSAMQSGSSCNIKLSIGGIVPVKTVRAKAVSRRVVTVCGTPFGIKMFADGAMVVGFSDIYTDVGYKNPAKTAGIKMGDVVMSIAGHKTKTNEDVSTAFQEVGGAPAQVKFLRDGKEKSTLITAVYDSGAKSWRTGMWVRDSTAGIGTLTFADNTNGVFAGLGHSIHDADTGKTVLLRRGEIVPVEITGVEKGESGMPGELKGRFTTVVASGDIVLNTEAGVYGKVYSYFKGKDTQVAQVQEIVTGEAQIFTTLKGNQAEYYNIVIEKIALSSDNPNKNMVIRVTDPRLLEQTGGIVQGMSGSPIFQNDMLIGAVTHVLVNDPTRGYAIFAQTMVQTADTVNQTNKKVA